MVNDFKCMRCNTTLQNNEGVVIKPSDMDNKGNVIKHYLMCNPCYIYISNKLNNKQKII